MKNKDMDWYDEKLRDIKKRKRNLKMVLDSEMVKRIKKDLKAEQRAAKRAEKQNINKIIKKEIDNYKND